MTGKENLSLKIEGGNFKEFKQIQPNADSAIVISATNDGKYTLTNYFNYGKENQVSMTPEEITKHRVGEYISKLQFDNSVTPVPGQYGKKNIDYHNYELNGNELKAFGNESQKKFFDAFSNSDVGSLYSKIYSAGTQIT